MHSCTAGALIAAIGVLGIVAIVTIVMIVKVLYLLTLYRALNRCSRESRTMEPGLVWLNLIPCFSLVWHFFIVLNLAKSLGAEFKRRGIPAEERPGQSLGLATCILGALAIFPAWLVCWILYWVKIAEYSRKLGS